MMMGGGEYWRSLLQAWKRRKELGGFKFSYSLMSMVEGKEKGKSAEGG